jgi:TatD DNase family protein
MSLPDLPDPLPSPVVDTHCHMDVTESVSGLVPEDALEWAKQVGVTRVVQIGCDLAGSRWAVEAATRWDNVVASVAIHPNDAARLAVTDDLRDALEEIEILARHPRVRAVGETGLDFYRTRDREGQQAQRQAFAIHIIFANETKKTLVVHDRDAHKEMLLLLNAEGPTVRTVMHCFSGDAEFAKECLDRDEAYLSFAGNITFKANGHLREALKVTPLDRILVETDAPYLTPIPMRGRPNASYLIPHTVRTMAEVLRCDLTLLCKALNYNAEAAFGGAWASLVQA